MSESSSGSARILKDSVIYMAAKAIEGIIGILIISRLTYLFADAEMGRFNLWNITATTFAMLSIQWLSQSASRYLNEYELKGNHKTFYSTVFSAWLKVNAFALFISFVLGIALFRAGKANIPNFLSFVYGDYVFLLAIAYFVTYNTSQMLIALLSVKRKVYTNLMISVLSAAGKLFLIIIFSGLFGAEIWVVFLSYIVCDIFAVIIALATLSPLKYVTRKGGSVKLLREFGHYGAPLVGNLATTTLLNNSDRFIIAQYRGEGDVGIYSTNYSVVSSVFTMLQTALMRGSYPTILKTNAEGDKELTEKLVSRAVRNYLLVAVPAVAGVGALARPIADLIFEEKFRGGYGVMVWVALGMMFLGLTEYSNKPWELSAKTWYIFRNSLIGGIANVAMNIVFVPYWGYMTAAYSTFAGFFIYFCLSKLESRKLMRWRLGIKTYASIIGSALVMGGCLIAALKLLGVTKLTLFVYVIAGVLIYGVFLALTGEIREEIRMAGNFINGRLRK